MAVMVRFIKPFYSWAATILLFAVLFFTMIPNKGIGENERSILTVPLFVGAESTDGDAVAAAKKRRIGLITAALPWSFGPYQRQMHELSILLSDEYDIYWVPYTVNYPDGVYRSYEEIKPFTKKLISPPKDFVLDHLTFVGVSDINDTQFSAKRINKIATRYGLELIITLMDVTRMQPDVPLTVPSIAWVPFHSDKVLSSSVDYWVLRHFHGIAALAPSSATSIDDAVGSNHEIEITDDKVAIDSQTRELIKKMSGTAQVEFIPHIIDRNELVNSGRIGLEWIHKSSSIAHADSMLMNLPLINRGQETSLEMGHERRSIFGNDRVDDFIILLQGGNYEDLDRKGWDTSLQAFAKFYHSLEDESKNFVHLLIHSMESYLIASDQNSDEDAPPLILPKGLNLRLKLHELGIPSDAYTIDIARHATEIISAYKTRADVCLHPSKVEGFGMNVVECQAVNTPVITTNYTAMGDYTSLGISTQPRQRITHPGSIYSLALPDVIGVADALLKLYKNHMAIKSGDEIARKHRQDVVEETSQWIDTTFSPTRVKRAFKDLLHRAEMEFNTRLESRRKLVATSTPPTVGAYKVASGYHLTIVDWDEPWTLIQPVGLRISDPSAVHRFCWSTLLNENDQETIVMAIQANYDDGTNVPFMAEDGSGPHEDLPLLVRTYVLTAIQGRSSRKRSLVSLAIGQAAQPKILPPGLAVISKNKNPRVVEDHNQFRTEL